MIESFDKTFAKGLPLSAREMNQISDKIDELIDFANNTGEDTIPDAPSDDKTYGRSNRSWVNIEDKFITETKSDEKYQPKGNYLTEVPSEYVTDIELTQELKSYAKTTDIPDVSGFATKEELQEKADVSSLNSKQDELISGTNIKTINGNSILGEGNVEIQGSGEGIADAPNDGSKYVRQNGNWVKETTLDTSTFATKDELNKKADKDEISDLLSKTEASSTYQPKGDYLTAIPDEYVTETELSEKGYLTRIPSEYVTDEELNAKGYATTTQLDSKLDAETYNSEKKTFALKSEIPEKYTLPIATAEALGGVKVGSGLSINPESGVLSATGGGTADSVDWANITSIPETFKPEAHQHVTADITDLQDKLDAKADTTVIADMATKTYVSEQGFLTEHQDISGLATKEEVTSGLESKQDKGNYLTVENASSTYQPKGNYITDESDPTVPLWAKSPTKPTYSASEVGAIAKGGLKTINGQSLEGSGDIELAGGGSDWVIKELSTNGEIKISNPFAEKKTIYVGENNGWFSTTYIGISFHGFIPSDYREVKIVVKMQSTDGTAIIYFRNLPSYIAWGFIVSVPGLGINKVVTWVNGGKDFEVDISGLLDSEKILNVVILMDNYGVTVL